MIKERTPGELLRDEVKEKIREALEYTAANLDKYKAVVYIERPYKKTEFTENLVRLVKNKSNLGLVGWLDEQVKAGVIKVDEAKSAEIEAVHNDLKAAAENIERRLETLRKELAEMRAREEFEK